MIPSISFLVCDMFQDDVVFSKRYVWTQNLLLLFFMSKVEIVFPLLQVVFEFSL